VLNRTTALDAWVERERPHDRTYRAVAEVVFQVGRVPWAWPSTPQTFAMGQPTEIREIAVEGTAVVITYESAHATGIVDLLLMAGR
jgi:hypothetical protein